MTPYEQDTFDCSPDGSGRWNEQYPRRFVRSYKILKVAAHCSQIGSDQNSTGVGCYPQDFAVGSTVRINSRRGLKVDR